jgi:glycosyltransferase involved in cell wall biosynthesis
MSEQDIDILMITHNRPAYTRLALDRLLSTCDETARVWIWQNGNDAETISVAAKFREHPRVFRYHHSETNVKLREPTNWILSNGEGVYVSKVDDDCLVPPDWLEVLRRAHGDEPRFGALGCWHFMPEDYRPDLAMHKIHTFRGGHSLLCHPWVNGSGFVLKRACVEKIGYLRERESGITAYLTRVALAGWINGWYFPFLWQEHMDDPRAPQTLLKSDEDLQSNLPLSALNSGVHTLEQWDHQLRRSAESLQRMPSDPRYYTPLRRRIRALFVRLTKAIVAG